MRGALRLAFAGVVAHATSVPVAAADLSPCAALAPLAQPPANARSVTEFGARPDDGRDDTDAIQHALDALRPDQWLVFPPGRYLHSKRLRVTVPGTKLWGQGAELRATDPRDAAVMLLADRASIYRFTLSGQARGRGGEPQQSGIVVQPPTEDAPPVAGNEVRGNRIVPAAPDNATGAAMSAGIFVFNARDFLVAENDVRRTLADGIHVTAGSAHGRIVNNTVRETGDDMIGIVSYLGRRGESARDIAAQLDVRRARRVVHDLVVEGNSLAGQYWGRGIALVGGRDVTIRANTIRDATRGAAIYIAREAAWRTAGVDNVTVELNDARRVQVTEPAFVPPGAEGRRRLGHGAIEVYDDIDADEARSPALAADLRIRRLRIGGNVIEDAAHDGIRVHAAGAGAIDDLGLFDNRIARVHGQPVAVGTAVRLACRGNRFDDRPLALAACGSVEDATGASLACLRGK